MALDGDLQQFITLHHHPHSALGRMVCSFWLVSSAGSDFGAMPFLEHRYAAAKISWVPAYDAAA